MDQKLNALYRRKNQALQDAKLAREKKAALAVEAEHLAQQVADLWQQAQEAKRTMRVEYEDLMVLNDAYEQRKEACRKARDVYLTQMPQLRKQISDLHKQTEQLYAKANKSTSSIRAQNYATQGKATWQQAQAAEYQMKVLEQDYQLAKQAFNEALQPSTLAYDSAKEQYETLKLRHEDAINAQKKIKQELEQAEVDYDEKVALHEAALIAFKERMRFLRGSQ